MGGVRVLKGVRRSAEQTKNGGLAKKMKLTDN